MTEKEDLPMVTVRPPDALSEGDGRPVFVRISGDPSHIWLNGQHFVQTDDRRAEPGKYYYHHQLEGMFAEVDEIEKVDDPEEREDLISSNDDFQQIEDPIDTIRVRIHYFAEDTQSTYQSDSESFDTAKRYALEADWPLNMGDVPPIPYVPANDNKQPLDVSSD